MEEYLNGYRKLLGLIGIDNIEIEKLAISILDLGNTLTLSEFINKIDFQMRAKFDQEFSKCNSFEEIQNIVLKYGIKKEELVEMIDKGQKNALENFIKEFLKNLSEDDKRNIMQKLEKEDSNLFEKNK